MTNARGLLVAAIALAACAGFTGEPVGPGFVVLERYEAAADARAARLFEGGLLPDVLPVGAGPIVESHDAKTGARCVRAEFPSVHREEIVWALLEFGFDAYRGVLPPPTACPFRIPIAPPPGEAFRNGEGKGGPKLYAIVADDVFFFWSARPADS